MDSQTAVLILKFGGLMIGIMLVVFLVALLTPKLAKFFEKRSGGSPERVEEDTSPEEYKVKGPYDASKLEDFDPNYKIYNTDIYAPEGFGRLKKNKDSSKGGKDQ